MITFVILLWILITMNAPVWTYILLGVGGIFSILKCGIDIGKILKGSN